MTAKQMATIINGALLPNRLNENATALSEDLSNWVDVGVLISNMTGDTLKDFQGMLAVGVKSLAVFNDVYDPETFGIRKSVEEFGNALQRVATKNKPVIQDSHATNLVNGTNYFDGTYYGAEYDAKLYVQSKMYKASYSWSDDTWAKAVSDAQEMNQLLTLWVNTVRSTINNINKGIVDMTLNKRIIDAYTNSKIVHLVTAYNSKFGTSETLASIQADETKMKRYAQFCAQAMRIVQKGMQKMGHKYNDGSVDQFTPAARVTSIYLTEFFTDLEYYGLANMYHPDKIELEKNFDTLSWQTDGTGMLPGYGTVDKIVDSSTYQHICAVCLDIDSLGLCNKYVKTTSEYIGSEGYVTYHEHFSMDNYTDNRGNAVIFCQD